MSYLLRRAREGASLGPSGGRVTRVLVVDDEAVIRGMMERLLAGKGYAVTAARDAEEAVTLAEQGAAFDVLVTDIVMPGMDGITLAKRLCEQFPSLRVVLVSGHADEASLCDVDPQWAFVRKPFDAKGLLEAVEPAGGDGR